MKNIITILGLMTVLIFSGVAIFASNQPAEEQEPYDEDTYGPEDPIVLSKPLKSSISSAAPASISKNSS